LTKKISIFQKERREKCISVDDLALKLGCSRNAIYKWQQGKNRIDDKYLAALKALKFSKVAREYPGRKA